MSMAPRSRISLFPDSEDVTEDAAFQAVNTMLAELGYMIITDRGDQHTIRLMDYPHRPFRWFGDNPLDVVLGRIGSINVGGCGTMANRGAVYDLKIPQALGFDIVFSTYPTPALVSIKTAAEQFNEAHGTAYPVDQIIQMHYPYEGDIEKILAALATGMPGKQVWDMLRMGYTHEEILQLRHTPVSLIFDGAPDRSKL